jgi:CelD/BcsL family acetyltransferase involved in cellulose biosynthesis
MTALIPDNQTLAVDRPVAQRLRASARPKVRVEWHAQWTSAVDEAFSALPYDRFMDPDIVRELWEHGQQPRRPQQIAVVRAADDTPVGVIPLAREGRLAWQLLPTFGQPYQTFHVLPGYTDAALRALDRFVACDNVIFHERPTAGALACPSDSWVVPLGCTYAELMTRAGFRQQDRRGRRKTQHLELLEDRFEDLPLGLQAWADTWRQRGWDHVSNGHMQHKLIVYRAWARRGLLKTFSLWDARAGKFAGLRVILTGASRAYGLLNATVPEYRACNAGVRGVLQSLEWAADNGFGEFDMLQTTGDFKRQFGAQPVVRAYRMVCAPFGSRSLAHGLEEISGFQLKLEYKLKLKR